jgi:hypothetical protein
MAESTAKQCEQECEQKSELSPDETIRQILKKLKEELQCLLPSDATKKFLTDITFVEQEYNGLPDVVAEYEAVYSGYKQSGPQYNTAECQWIEIRKWDQSSPPLGNVKEAIKTLREESYRDETEFTEEEPPNDNHPKKILDESKRAFRSIKSCYDQRQEEEGDILAEYNEKKTFKKTVDGWFTDLKDLHGQTKSYNDKKKYRSLHAVYLEAEQVWRKINGLTSKTPAELKTPAESKLKTPAELKKELTEKLWKVLQAKDERFRWHQDWLDMQLAVTNAQTNYDTFKTNRRKDFIREAEDVEAEDGAPTNGGPGYGTGQGPATYSTTTPVEQRY